MKCLLVLALSCAFFGIVMADHEEVIARFKDSHKKCREQDDAADCLNACILKKLELVDDQFTINLEQLKSYGQSFFAEDVLATRVVTAIFESCKDIPKSDDKCMNGNQLQSCIISTLQRLSPIQ